MTSATIDLFSSADGSKRRGSGEAIPKIARAFRLVYTSIEIGIACGKSRATRDVLAALVDLISLRRPRAPIFCSRSYLVERTGVSMRTVERALSILQKSGLLTLTEPARADNGTFKRAKILFSEITLRAFDFLRDPSATMSDGRSNNIEENQIFTSESSGLSVSSINLNKYANSPSASPNRIRGLAQSANKYKPIAIAIPPALTELAAKLGSPWALFKLMATAKQYGNKLSDVWADIQHKIGHVDGARSLFAYVASRCKDTQRDFRYLAQKAEDNIGRKAQEDQLIESIEQFEAGSQFLAQEGQIWALSDDKNWLTTHHEGRDFSHPIQSREARKSFVEAVAEGKLKVIITRAV